MIDYIWFIPVGILISTFATIVGIGGGLLWAPFFVLLLKMPAQEAAIYSFAVQIVGMASATVSNIIKRHIYWKMVLILIPAIIFGEAVGSFVSQRLASSTVLQGGMGLMSIFVSLFFAFQPEHYDTILGRDRKDGPPIWLTALCVPFGTLSGLFSVGIGDNLVPLLRGRLKVVMSDAIGTCLFLNLLIAVIGFSFHITLGTLSIDLLNKEMLAMCWVGVFIGGQLGPRLGQRIGDDRLKEIFIFVLMLIGIHLLYKAM